MKALTLPARCVRCGLVTEDPDAFAITDADLDAEYAPPHACPAVSCEHEWARADDGWPTPDDLAEAVTTLVDILRAEFDQGHMMVMEPIAARILAALTRDHARPDGCTHYCEQGHYSGDDMVMMEQDAYGRGFDDGSTDKPRFTSLESGPRDHARCEALAAALPRIPWRQGYCYVCVALQEAGHREGCAWVEARAALVAGEGEG